MRNKVLQFFVLVILIIFIFSGTSLAGEGLFGFESGLERIDKLRKQGRVSRDESVYRKLQYILEPDKLPKDFRGVPLKSATFELQDLQKAAKTVKDPKIKQQINRYYNDGNTFYKGGMVYDQAVAYYSGLSDLTNSYSSSNFKVWYTKNGTDAVPAVDGNSNNVPDYVETVSAQLEFSRNYQIGKAGFAAPPGDSGKYNVFLKNLYTQGLLYGLTVAGGSSYSWPSFIVMENDFINFPGSVEDNIKNTTAHEFFHAVHFGYNPFHTDTSNQNRWWAEASAVWMENRVHPQLRGYIDYTYHSNGYELLGWFADPERSMTNFSGLHPYGSSIFARFLEERTGSSTVIRKVWYRLSRYEKDLGQPGAVINAINKVLVAQDKGTFNTLFANFISRNFNMAGYRDRTYIKAKKAAVALWKTYPYDIYVMNQNPYNNYPVSKSFKSSYLPLPQYLGSNYHVFSAGSTGKTFYFKSGKDLAGKRQGKFIVNLLLRKKGTESYVIKRLLSSTRTENFLAVPGLDNITYDRAVIAAGVVGPVGNNYKYTYSFSAKNISKSSISSTKTTVLPGRTVKFRSVLSPKHAGMTNVYLQRSKNGASSWSNAGKMSWNSSVQKYVIAYKPSASSYYRVYWLGDKDHGRNYSPKIKVTVQ